MKLADTSLDPAQKIAWIYQRTGSRCVLNSELRAPLAGRVQKDSERSKNKAEIFNVCWEGGC